MLNEEQLSELSGLFERLKTQIGDRLSNFIAVNQDPKLIKLFTSEAIKPLKERILEMSENFDDDFNEKFDARIHELLRGEKFEKELAHSLDENFREYLRKHNFKPEPRDGEGNFDMTKYKDVTWPKGTMDRVTKILWGGIVSGILIAFTLGGLFFQFNQMQTSINEMSRTVTEINEWVVGKRAIEKMRRKK